MGLQRGCPGCRPRIVLGVPPRGRARTTIGLTKVAELDGFEAFRAPALAAYHRGSTRLGCTCDESEEPHDVSTKVVAWLSPTHLATPTLPEVSYRLSHRHLIAASSRVGRAPEAGQGG